MDKSYLNCKEETVCVEKCSRGGAALILSTLACICVAFTFMNLTFRLYSPQKTEKSFSDSVIAISETIIENEAVAAFLGLDEYENK